MLYIKMLFSWKLLFMDVMVQVPRQRRTRGGQARCWLASIANDRREKDSNRSLGFLQFLAAWTNIDHVVYKHIMFVAVTVIDVPVQVQRLPVQAPRLPVRHPHDDSVIHAFLYGFCSTIQQKVLQRAPRLA